MLPLSVQLVREEKQTCQRDWHCCREYMQPGYDAWGFISCTGNEVTQCL